MTRDQIIRAWKDEDYRQGLDVSQLASLPENPAGLVDLNDAELGMVGGREEVAITRGCWSIIAGITDALDCWKSLVFASCEAGTQMCCP